MSHPAARSETKRLRFEPLRSDHADLLFPALADPLVYQFLNEDPPASVAALTADFARVSQGPPPDRSDERWVNFAVQLKADGRWIGRVQATVHPAWAEIGFLFESRSWGRGYGGEAVAWLHDHLTSIRGAIDVWATAAPDNERSIRLLQCSGYQIVEARDAPRLDSFVPGDVVLHRPAASN